jgi:hypothetical protein
MRQNKRSILCLELPFVFLYDKINMFVAVPLARGDDKYRHFPAESLSDRAPAGRGLTSQITAPRQRYSSIRHFTIRYLRIQLFFIAYTVNSTLSGHNTY